MWHRVFAQRSLRSVDDLLFIGSQWSSPSKNESRCQFQCLRKALNRPPLVQHLFFFYIRSSRLTSCLF